MLKALSTLLLSLTLSVPLFAGVDPFSAPVTMSDYTTLVNDIFLGSYDPASGEKIVHSKLRLYSPNANRRLLTQQKRSIRLLNSLVDNEANERILADHFSQAVTPDNLAQAFGYRTPLPLSDYWIFANFVHGNWDAENARFWIAVIPKHFAVEKVIYQVQWFAEGAGGHGQTRFLLDTDILLIPQNTDVQWQPPVDLTDLDFSQKTDRNSALSQADKPVLVPGDLIYSLYAVRAEGGRSNWGPVEGALGEYANALQVFSTVHKAEDQTNRSFVEQYELPIRQGDTGFYNQYHAKWALEGSLMYSNQVQETEIYHTVINSCINHSLRSLSGYELFSTPLDGQTFNPYKLEPHILAAGGTPHTPFNFEFNGTITDICFGPNARLCHELQSQKGAGLLVRTQVFDNVVLLATGYFLQNELYYNDVNLVIQQLKAADWTKTPEEIIGSMVQAIAVEVAKNPKDYSPTFSDNDRRQQMVGEIVSLLNSEVQIGDMNTTVGEILKYLNAVRTQNGL